MTPFQWIFGGILVSAVLAEFALQYFRLTRPRISWVRTLVWSAALFFVLYPNVLQQVAERLRIGRGADFLLYLLAVCFPLGGFYLLHAIEKQRQQITQLVRALAARDLVHEPRDQLAESDSAECA